MKLSSILILSLALLSTVVRGQEFLTPYDPTGTNVNANPTIVPSGARIAWDYAGDTNWINTQFEIRILANHLQPGNTNLHQVGSRLRLPVEEKQIAIDTLITPELPEGRYVFVIWTVANLAYTTSTNLPSNHEFTSVPAMAEILYLRNVKPPAVSVKSITIQFEWPAHGVVLVPE